MPPLLMRLIFDHVASAPMPFFVKPIANGIVKRVRSSFIDPRMKSNLYFLESELTGHDWFVGNKFSATDVQLSFPLEAASSAGGLVDRPRLHQFLARIHDRPGYQRVLARGRKYDIGR